MSLKGPTQVKDKKQWQGLIKIIAYIFVVILMIIFIFLLVSLWIKIDQFQIIQQKNNMEQEWAMQQLSKQLKIIKSSKSDSLPLDRYNDVPNIGHKLQKLTIRHNMLQHKIGQFSSTCMQKSSIQQDESLEKIKKNMKQMVIDFYQKGIAQMKQYKDEIITLIKGLQEKNSQVQRKIQSLNMIIRLHKSDLIKKYQKQEKKLVNLTKQFQENISTSKQNQESNRFGKFSKLWKDFTGGNFFNSHKSY